MKPLKMEDGRWKIKTCINIKSLLSLLLLFISSQHTFAQPPAEQLFRQLVEAELSLEIIGETEETIRFPPRDQATQSSNRLSQPARISPRRVLDNFELSIDGTQETDGRSLIRIDFIPKNGISPRWRFWIDRETSLRVAYEQRTALGDVIAEGRYTSIERIKAHDERRPLPTDPVLGPVKRRILERLMGDTAWPQGFVPIQLERSQIAGRSALRFIAWDGLNILVLFIYPKSQQDLPEETYLRSTSVASVGLSALSPLPPDSLDAWLNQLKEAPLKQLNERRIQNCCEGL